MSILWEDHSDRKSGANSRTITICVTFSVGRFTAQMGEEQFAELDGLRLTCIGRPDNKPGTLMHYTTDTYGTFKELWRKYGVVVQ